MAASLAETSSSKLPLPSLGQKRPRKPITELAPCFTPFGQEKVYAEGSVFEMPTEEDTDVKVLAVLKKPLDQERVTAINKILAVPDPNGDEVWVLPEQPGKEDRSKRFRLMKGGGLEISLFNGSFLQAEYDLTTGVLRNFVNEDENHAIPPELPTGDLKNVLRTMSGLMFGEPLELTQMQTFVNFPRDHKLEGF